MTNYKEKRLFQLTNIPSSKKNSQTKQGNIFANPNIVFIVKDANLYCSNCPYDIFQTHAKNCIKAKIKQDFV